jgi:hypothetical protein
MEFPVDRQFMSENHTSGEWSVRLLVGVAVGWLTAVTFRLVQVWWPSHLSSVAEIVTLILAAEGVVVQFLVNLLFGKALDSLLLRFLPLTGFVVGFWSGISRDWLWRFAHEHFGLGPDRKVLTPVPAPRPYDPLWGPLSQGKAVDAHGDPLEKGLKPLDWIPPASGARLEAWKSLWKFAQHGSSDGRYTLLRKGKWGRWFPASEDYRPFQWTVLTGRSGSGKTRMAVEFLRRQLGRVPELGELPGSRKHDRGAQPDSLSPTLGWWERKKVEWGEWFRRIWPTAVRRIGDPTGEPGDPWDIGWITNARERRERTHLSDFSSLLVKWRPRRPTAFLLDEPLAGDASKLLEIFVSRASHYRYPVRLLIVNQSLPGELEFERAADGNNWKSQIGQFYGQLVVLSEETAFTEHEIFGMAHQLPPPVGAWTKDSPEAKTHLNTIMRITDGNPLLVEIALRLLAAKVEIARFTADDLILERAKYIFDALNTAHPALGDEDFSFLASAALSGPHSAPETLEQFRDKMPHYSKALKRCFNLETSDAVLPAVRPQRVGDTFVLLVLREKCRGVPERQRMVAERAWRWNAQGVLRSVERTAARDDELGSIMRAGPPRDMLAVSSKSNKPIIKPLDLAYAYAVASAHYVLGHPFPTRGSALALARASVHIRYMPAADAAASMDLMFGLFSVDEAVTCLWAGAACNCYLQSIGRMIAVRAFSGDTAEIMDLIDKAEWRFSGRSDVDIYAYEAGDPFGSDIKHSYVALKSLAHAADDHAPSAPCNQQYELRRAIAWTLAAWAAALSGALESCQMAAKRVDRIATRFPGRPEFQLQRARAQQSVRSAFGGLQQAQGVAQSARFIDEIASGFSTDARLALESASAWAGVASVNSDYGTLEACQEAVTIVKSIVNRFRSEQGLRERLLREYVFASCALCLALGKSGRLRECADEVRDIDSSAHDFLARPYFVYLRVAIRKNICFAYSFNGIPEDYIDVKKTATDADSIGSAFPQYQGVQYQRAEMWSHFSFYCARCGQVGDCLDAVDRVDDIARRFGAVRLFAKLRLQTWASVCSANAIHGTVEGCREAIERVDEISKFSAHPVFRVLRAQAWRAFSFTLARFARVRECSDAMRVVEGIALESIADVDLSSEWARAQKDVCWVNANFGTAEACRQAANKVRSIAARFPGRPQLNDELAECQRLADFAEQKKALDPLGQWSYSSPRGSQLFVLQPVRFPASSETFVTYRRY